MEPKKRINSKEKLKTGRLRKETSKVERVQKKETRDKEHKCDGNKAR